MDSIHSLGHFTEYPYAEGDPERIVVLHYSPDPSDTHSGARGTGSVHLPSLLQKHLEWIYGLGYTPITFSDYRHFLRGELHLPRRPIILTFDSSLDDIDEETYRPLFESGGRGVLFVVTGTDGLAASHGSARGEGVKTQTRERLRRLHERGLEIGSLTCTNRQLSGLTAAECEKELIHSKLLIEEILQRPVISVAYPGYNVRPDVKRAVIKAAYEFAAGGPQAPAVFGTDLYEIRRIRITHEVNRAAFALTLFAPTDRLERLRRKSRSFFQRGTSQDIAPEATV